MITLSLVVLALAGVCAAFALVFLLARTLGNYGIVAVAWPLAFTGIVILYGLNLPGWYLRKFTIAAMVVLWSVRLAAHLLKRTVRTHPREDGRYAALRHAWAGRQTSRMLGLYLLQAVSVVVLATPFFLTMLNPDPRIGLCEKIGVVLWFIGLYGVSIADTQLDAFRREAPNAHAVCTAGLWRFSRHPNYFFEALVWIAFCVFAFGSPDGWIALIAPALILYLLLQKTGIPPNEAQALRTRGEAYRRYQATTSRFIPWFPRKPPAAVEGS